MEFQSYSSAQNADFGEPDPAFEHFQHWPKDASFELVETSYFGFNIPEEQINAEIYHWYHPMLGVATGGIYIWQGIKPVQLAAEYYDYRHFLPMPDDVVNCTQPSGVHIEMLEPNRRFQITFEDPERSTALNLELNAVMPLAVRARGGHFTQAMRTKGSLKLRGRDYIIDGYYTRDRSWGDDRTEKPIPMPPLAWAAGIFDDDFAFHLTSFDTPSRHSDWAAMYPTLRDGDNHLWGYLWHDGRLLGIRRVDQSTIRESDGLSPHRLTLTIEDTDGGVHDINGRIEARLPRHAWDNMMTHFCLTRWECNNRIGYGDWQDILFGDHIRRMLSNSDSTP